MVSEVLLVCLKIFFCRILDVTLGSMRTVLVVKERTALAACIGFFEVFIWYIVVRDAINCEGPVIPIALCYAAGYASGTFIGGTLAKQLVGGHVTLHVITSHRNPNFQKILREAGYGITVLNVQGSEYGDDKNLILADFEKKRLDEFQTLVKALDPEAFIIVQETKSYLGGYRYRRPGK
jgi:Uncharacterized protein conserved in bacteria